MCFYILKICTSNLAKLTPQLMGKSLNIHFNYENFLIIKGIPLFYPDLMKIVLLNYKNP